MHTFGAGPGGMLPCGGVLRRGEASRAAPTASAWGLPPPTGLGASITVTERDFLWRDSVSTSPGATGWAAAQARQALPEIRPRPGLRTAQTAPQRARAAPTTAECRYFPTYCHHCRVE